MTKLFTSDWHLDHTNVLKYSSRPFYCTKEMEDHFFKNFSDIFKRGDLLYYLGDFSVSSSVRTRDSIQRGLDRFYNIGVRNIQYIFGNHDYNYKKQIESHKVIGWTGDLKVTNINVNGVKNKVVLSHYPMRSWPHSNYDSYMLHGHCHATLLKDSIINSFDVGIDSAYTMLGEYRVFTEEDIVEKMIGLSGLKWYMDSFYI